MNNGTSPKISVVMPNYNGFKFIADAIESILKQTFSDFEFIIIDDGSTDDSWEIIGRYAQKDSRIKALRNEKNRMICYTLNEGVLMAEGEYIARMDSDDVAHPDWLEKTLSFMEMPENENVGVCGANYTIIDEEGKKVGEKIYPETDMQCRKAFWSRNPHGHSSVIIRKKCFSEFGLYDENYIYAEDLELWMRFGQKYEQHNVQEFLIDYRISGSNSTLQKQRKMIRNTLKARKKARDGYGYHMCFAGRIFYMGTWIAQWFPPKLVLSIFNLIRKN